jgi:hypothetical protein
MLPTFNELASLYSCMLNCSMAKRKVPQLLFAIANKIINSWVGVTQQVEGERLVVREDGKRAAIQDVVKVSDARVAGEKFLSKADCLTRPSLASLKRSQGK